MLRVWVGAGGTTGSWTGRCATWRASWRVNGFCG